MIMSAKHAHRLDMESFLEAAGHTLGEAVEQSGVLEESGAEGEVWVIPAPSSWKRRWGGTSVTPVLARGVARGIAQESGRRVRLVDAVALKWGRKSQSGKGRRERRNGRVGAMVLRVEDVGSVPVVLVDDVVTTGATVRELDRVTQGRACAVVALSSA